MIFDFLKYLHPTWYFNLYPEHIRNYFPKSVARDDGSIMAEDSGYHSVEARKRDLAYRAFHQGYISKKTSSDKGLNIWEPIKISIHDQYRFLRKNFNTYWVWYVFVLRILSLKNPFLELRELFRTRSVRYQKNAPLLFNPQEYNGFDSKLLSEKPLVSIIIPTLNRYAYLKDILQDLEQQTYPHFEVLVIDQSEPYEPEFYEEFNLSIRLIRQKEKALWMARNQGVQQAKGQIIAFSEDDVRIKRNWLEEHLKCLDFWKADISCGVFFPKGAEIPANRSFFKYAEQFATGNACLYRNVFESTGLFDRNFEGQRMGDGEFGLRAYLTGFLSISTPYASCEDVKAPTGGLRQMGSWDAFRPKSFWSPRPIPSVLYFYRKYFGDKAAILSLLKNIPPSLVPYAFKRNRVLLILGTALSLFFIPLLFLQVCRSWKQASRKLGNQKIDQLSS
ncbi:glycosyltransferase family 2 protein [Roseivirga sp. E12]|uniref:glycosyltransferase family 2 protein n=1 Tax=Roseivirga sp. E12 TaxID=2819237 RepID=UPI001ABC58D6|nr:glycosyltransferase family A protein [Roseivirga sp. E12]MBO3699077.1 glycosyltransferase family 2 protein [Roseivirga sp. E12]